MKSIYEASVAYGIEHQGTVNIEDFEAGANYVLDIIQRFVIETHFNLEHIVKQLKK